MIWFVFVMCALAAFAFFIAVFSGACDSHPLVFLICSLLAFCFLFCCFHLYFEATAVYCSGCGSVVGTEAYCSTCGYELIPHCIDCGEVCRTAFCKLCGAEQ